MPDHQAGAQANRAVTPLNHKTIIIINGRGGSGKDTLCEIAAEHFRTKNISAITPIKEMAKRCGWNGEKDSKSRKFLADLKQAFIAYNDLPGRYLEEECRKFAQGDDDLLFVHIREGDQIDAFKRRAGMKCVTLLVRSPRTAAACYGNDADDLVDSYHYDYCYENAKPLDQLAPDFLSFLRELLIREGALPESAQ